MNTRIAFARPIFVLAIAIVVALALPVGAPLALSAYAAEEATAGSPLAASPQVPVDEPSAPPAPTKSHRSLTLASGLYELRSHKGAKLCLGVSGSSTKNRANAALCKRTGANNQKFVILPAGNGYYRIKMAMGKTVLAVANASTKSGANVRMEKRRNSSAQLWKPVGTASGIALVNKKSSKRLAFTGMRSGANVRQSSRNTPERLATWTLAKTKLDGCDEKSFRTAIGAASDGGLKLGNSSGYKVSARLWKRLKANVSACRARKADVSFIMADLGTGMTVSLHPDRVRFGASTIKGLYVTYLFESYLEKGCLTWSDIASLAHPTIVHSSNSAYRTLRGRFGTESGFARWLKSAGVGPIGTWGDYSARTLAKAWTHMAGYAASKGRYVKTWKKLFSRSDHSFIREALAGGGKSTYTKPGWMESGTWSGTIMNDAGIVGDSKANRYLLAFVTTVDPDANRHQLRSVVKTLDSISKEMKRKRGW